MVTLIFVNFFVFMIVCAIATFRGLDLKKRSSWWYGLYGFISGFLIGFLRSDGNGGYHLVTNLGGSFQVGALFAFLVMFGSVMTRWQRGLAKKYEDRAERSLEEKYDNLAEKLLNKKARRK